jgi:hypothetical protein
VEHNQMYHVLKKGAKISITLAILETDVYKKFQEIY